MKNSNRWAIVALSLLIALLGIWGTIAAAGRQSPMPLAAPLSAVKVAAPAAQAAEDEPPLVGYPCGDGAQMPYWTICLHGDLLNAAGQPAGREGVPVTVSFGGQTKTSYTRTRPGQPGAAYAIDISKLNPDYMGEVTLTVGELGPFKVIVAPDLRTQNLRFDVPVDGAPAGRAAEDPVVVWGYVIDFLAREPLAGVPVTIATVDDTGEHLARTVTTQHDNQPWPIYTFTQAQLDAAGVVLTDRVPYPYTITTSYNGDSVRRDRTWTAGEESAQVNLFTNWMCDTPGEGGGRDQMPKPPESGVAPRLKPDGLPETTGADGLPDMGCFWGYVEGTNGEEENVTVRLEVAGQVMEDTTFKFEHDSGDGRPRYGIIVQGLADIQGQPLTVTAVLSGSTAVYTGTVALDAAHSQQIDLQLDVNGLEGELYLSSGTNSIAILGNSIYAGTDNGLIRFNAATETGDPVRVPGGPGAAPVGEVMLDKDSCLWLASRGQPFRYCPFIGENGTWSEFDEEETGASVTAIAFSPDGAVWFGSADGYLRIYRRGHTPEWGVLPVPEATYIRDVSISSTGIVWAVGSRNSADEFVGRYDAGVIDPWSFYVMDSSTENYSSEVAAYHSGAWLIVKWAGAFRSGVSTGLNHAIPGESQKIDITYLGQVYCVNPGCFLTAIKVDADENFWTAHTEGVSVYEPDTDAWRLVLGQDVETATSLAIDRLTQTIWLGTADGISQYDIASGNQLKAFTRLGLYRAQTSFPDVKDVRAIADTLFVVSSEDAGQRTVSLNSYDASAFEYRGILREWELPLLETDSSLALAADGRSLWMALPGFGASHYVPGAAQPWTDYEPTGDSASGLIADTVYAITESKGKVYFATNKGVSVMSPGAPPVWRQPYTDDILTTGTFSGRQSMVTDAGGNIWLTIGQGYSKGNRLVVYIQATDKWQECYPEDVGSITLNPKSGGIWAATYTYPRGINTIQSLVASDTGCLPESTVQPPTGLSLDPDAIAVDHNGALWVNSIGLFGGIRVFDVETEEWSEVADSLFIEALVADLENNTISGFASDRVTRFSTPALHPDLNLTLQSPSDWKSGNLNYTLVITNTGLRPATDTTLTFDLPAGFAFDSATCGTEACAPSTTTPLTWSLGQFEPGEVRMMTITATGNAPVDTTLEATATTATTAAEAYTANNTAGPAPTLVLDVRPDARISLVGPTELKPGTTVTFTLRADNAGGSAVTGDVTLDLGPYLSTAVTRWPGVVLAASTDPNRPAPAWEQTIQVSVAANAPPNTRLSPRAIVTVPADVSEPDPGNNESVVTIPTTLADARTLIVVATAQLEAVYGASTILDDAYRLAGHDAVHGTVLDVSTDDAVAAAYEAWNAAHDGAATDANALANATAEAIGRRVLVELSANPQIQYVVIVGGDHVIPFFRRADHNPTQWQESTYAGAFLPTNTTVYEALWANTFLTDDCYTDHQRTPVTASGWFGPDLCIPDLAVGRLVETPQEIRAAVDAFVAIGGEVTLGPAIVGSTAGDDDGADEAGDESGLTLDLDDNQCQLLRKAGLVARCRQSNRRFRERLLDTHFTTAVAAQHSSHYGVGLFRSSDVLESDVSYVGMLLATIGCHAGLSVPPRAPGSEAVDHDMPQAILGRGGTLIGLTTYGYGTKEGMGYSESFSRLLTQELLRAEPGQVVEIGPAIVRAKQAYITRHWGEAGAAGGFTYLDEKVVLPVTLYGLPMLRVRLPDTAGQARLGLVPPAPADVRLTASTTISTVHVVNPALYHEYSLAGGRYFDYDGQLFERVGLPLQPARDLALPVASGVRTARGALLRSATFTTFAPFTPYRAQAWALSAEGQTTTQPVKRGPIYMPLVAYQSPVSPWDHTLPFRFVYLDYGGSSAYLFTVLGAYNEHTGEERRYDSLVVDIVYGDGDDVTPPAIVQSDSFAAYGHLRLLAQAGDPSGISQVIGVCEYAAEGRWVSVDLRREGERWLGSCPTAEGVTRTLLQVVDGAGNVTIGEWQTPPTTTLTGPDLIVESVVATRDGIQITIRNVGTAAVTPEQGFWVDVYLAPDPPPAAEDDVWGDGRSDYGAAWAVEQAIPPGGAVTLTTTNGTPDPTHTRLPARLPLGAAVYAQVDSWSMATTYGGVLEMHELGDGPYNNVFGPVEVEATGRLGGASSTTRAAGASVPARPEVTR